MLLNPIKALIILLCLTFSIAAYCEDNPSWGKSAKKTRVPVEGMDTFYQPESLKKDDEMVASFTMYSSYEPTASDPGVKYKINCETREYVKSVSKGWTQPERILPGEQLYPFAKKICEWDTPGLFGRIKNNILD